MIIAELIESALKRIPIVPPLQQFVSINPYADMTEQSFQYCLELVNQLEQDAGRYLLSEHLILQSDDCAADMIERQLLSALNQVFCQPDGTTEQMILQYWSDYYPLDDSLLKAIGTSGMLEREIERLLIQELKIPASIAAAYLFHILWRVKGWVGYSKWLATHPQHPLNHPPLEPAALILMWLSAESVWLARTRDNHQRLINSVMQQHSAAPPLFDENRWRQQQQQEQSAHTELIAAMAKVPVTTAMSPTAATTNWVFCIDTRSESLRRALEQQPHNSTDGFAGFFGVACSLKTAQATLSQCPDIISPNLTFVCEESQPKNALSQFIHDLSNLKKASQKTPFAELVLVEMIGLGYAVAIACKNTLNKLMFRLKTWMGFSQRHECQQQLARQDLSQEIDFQQALDIAKFVLTSTGLASRLTRLVIFCGHGATTTNNPYQATYDCGACGGNAGFVNAQAICQILNNQRVRDALAAHSILIPDETIFAAAFHDTTQDTLTWQFIPPNLTIRQQQWLEQAQADAAQACALLNVERQPLLPGDADVVSRASHWAELIPEWGLLNNYAMVIAPRALTQSLNLQQQVFLHSYDDSADPNGECLTQICLGPVLVAHWINMQYYFSAVAPKHHSAGNKAVHHLLNQIGVMIGNQSDLKTGLPLQSVYYRDQCLHRPARLLVLIAAKPAVINNIINKHTVLRQLVDGEWLFIKALQ